MRDKKITLGALLFMGLILSCMSPRSVNSVWQNNSLRESIVQEHLKKNDGDYINFFVTFEGNKKNRLIYRVFPITNPFNATFMDSVGKYSENLPYEFILSEDVLFLFEEKNSKLSKDLIEILNKRTLVDSTLFNYGKKGSEIIQMTTDTMYFEGKPIRGYHLDETIKAYYYKVDTLNQKYKTRFWKKSNRRKS